MESTYANSAWRKSVSDLDWGILFSPLAPEVMWVLENNIQRDEFRTIRARQLAAAMRFIGNSYLYLAVSAADRPTAQPVLLLQDMDEFVTISVAAQKFATDEIAEMKEDMSSMPWPMGIEYKDAMEILEVAITRWYVVNGQAGGKAQKLCLSVPEICEFHFIRKDRTSAELSAMGVS